MISLVLHTSHPSLTQILTKSSYFGTRKHHRWKWNSNFYTHLHNNPHNHRQSQIISTNIAVNNAFESGQLDLARKLFDEMPDRTVVSWNTMISGYSRRGKFSEALSLVSVMHCSNMKLNETTFSSILSVCARLPSHRDGKQVHCLVLKSGSESFELVGSSLLYFYANCFEIQEARRVFDVLHEINKLLWSLMLVGYVQCNLLKEALDVFNAMPNRDVVAWTTMISGYSKSDDGCEKALELFWLMRECGKVAPNEFTLDCVIRTCGRVGLLHEGRAVHGLFIKYGFAFEHSISGALIDFYCNCKAIDDAMRVYYRLLNPCSNDSNMLIGELIMMGRIEEAELIFNGLVQRNLASYNLMLKGYSLSGRIEDSKKLFDEMPQRNLASSNTMISVYSRNGEMDKALELFEETKEEGNPVTWNSMISGYIYNDQHENALNLYVTMHTSSISQTRSTFSALFHACSCLGSLQQGQLLHAHLIKTPFVSNAYVGTALVDMYSKCGSITDAQASFICISYPNVAAWTALINGYAHHGLGSEAVLLLERMLDQGVNPNAATFVGVLSACTRAGLVNEGMRFIHTMKECYGVTPTIEHFTCAVDLLGRSGHLQEAEELIKEMPIEADSFIWVALLNACWFWMDMKVGERVAEKMFTLDPKPLSAYVIMSNIYAVLGKWGEKMQVRKILMGLKVKKDRGCSWIEINNGVHVFSVQDRTHPCCNAIYSTLGHLTTNCKLNC